jgi:hypothetical protein
MGGDPAELAVRLRVSRLLSAAHLDPGLPRSAILVIRRVEDPMPEGIRVRDPAVRPPDRWQRAMRGSVARAWRRAARPLEGPVPARAPAVLFADPAEMLAALALDSLAGAVPSRWWWAALLRSPGDRGPGALARAWLREARHVPATLALLAERGVAGRVVGTFQPAEANAILRSVAAEFGLASLERVFAAGPARGGLGPDGSAPRPDPRADAPVVPHEEAVPWAGLLADHAVPAGLGRVSRALLAVGLLLARAPLRAGSGAFASGMARWYAGETEPASRGPTDRAVGSDLPGPSRFARPGGGRDGADPDPPAAGDTGTWAGHDPTTRGGDRARANAPAQPGPAGLADGAPLPPAPSGPAGPADGAPLPPAPSGDPDAAEAPAADPASPEVTRPVPSAATRPDLEVHSALCGVFYLINALRSTGWFERAAERLPGAPVATGWGWLELVARGLLGADAVPGDAVWRVLARLDGREHDGEPSSANPDASTQWFLAEALPPLRRRLEIALRTRGGRGDLNDMLLRRDGVIRAGRTHVDVHMPMDQVALPVRLAGLDTDPGWVPQLGRIVHFHYGPSP